MTGYALARQRLSDAVEIVVGVPGQSNARPWGHRKLEGEVAAPHLALTPAGLDLTVISLDAYGATQAQLTPAETLGGINSWERAAFRLWHADFGDSVSSTYRRGLGYVASNTEAAAIINLTVDPFVKVVTITIASPGVVTWVGHGWAHGTRIVFSTTDTLPTGLTPGVAYYVKQPTADTFWVSETVSGPSINTSGSQAGVHTCTAKATATVTFDLASASEVTFDIASPGTVNWTQHGLAEGSPVVFTTTDTLPAALTPGTVYYVMNPTTDEFEVSATAGGTSIDFVDAGTGTHTATFSGMVNWTAHAIPNGARVVFSTTSKLPTGMLAGYIYNVANPSVDGFQLLYYPGSPVVSLTASQGGVHTGSYGSILSVSGNFTVTHRESAEYDEVRVLHCYQPEAPGDYPAGVPSVPGYSFPSTITTYADCGLLLPFTYNEGIEGTGFAGTDATVSSLVVTLPGLTMLEDFFVDGFIRVGPSWGKVAASGTGTVTVVSWTPGNPGAGPHPYELLIPHFRDNPNRVLEGFRYPSNDHQPGGAYPNSTGTIYNRPRGRTSVGPANTPGGCYTARLATVPRVRLAINALEFATGTGPAQTIAHAAPDNMVATVGLFGSPSAWRLRIRISSGYKNFLTGLVQFEDFVAPGHVVRLFGWTPATIDGSWRVEHVERSVPSPTSGGGTGSYIILNQLSPNDPPVPESYSGTATVGLTLASRIVYEPQQRFGMALPMAWRLAAKLNRRINLVMLGVNASSQVPAGQQNIYGYQGTIGWWDDNKYLDWSGGDPDTLDDRFERMLSVILPAALLAEGNTRTAAIALMVRLQGEADSATAAGRELYFDALSSFYARIRQVIEDNGLSPYRDHARTPLVHPQIPAIPWEGSGLDEEGETNASIVRFVNRDGGFAATYDTDDQTVYPKLDGSTVFGTDPAHYNGVAEAAHGKTVADLAMPLIEYALSFGPGANDVSIANQALALIGEPPNVTSLSPPNATTQAQDCARFINEAKDIVLQWHPWSIATKRVTPPLLTHASEVVSTWLFAYAMPADLLLLTGIFDPAATDETLLRSPVTVDAFGNTTSTEAMGPTDQKGVEEVDATGLRILRTNQASAVLRYTSRNVDVGVLPPLVRQALAWRLAHFLAGARVRGQEGAGLALRALQLSEQLLEQAAASDANYTRDVNVDGKASWMP